MATVRVSIVHDDTGRIVSVSRPAENANVIVLSGDGQSVLETEVDEESVNDLVAGKHLVDAGNKKIVEKAP
ncbi:hypothetical protein ACFQ6B_11315 [Streptomyces wedmorensis]|uniref:Uncharacterized protein n=1 Tax=Streptomyces wedmorensis TaxID=43759 RepID=A0ABW6J5W0_STRWE